MELRIVESKTTISGRFSSGEPTKYPLGVFACAREAG